MAVLGSPPNQLPGIEGSERTAVETPPFSMSASDFSMVQPVVKGGGPPIFLAYSISVSFHSGAKKWECVSMGAPGSPFCAAGPAGGSTAPAPAAAIPPSTARREGHSPDPVMSFSPRPRRSSGGGSRYHG